VFFQFQAADLIAVHFVGSVGDPQEAGNRKSSRQSEVVGDAGTAERLSPNRSPGKPCSAPRL
jgi:hypothetical protein